MVDWRVCVVIEAVVQLRSLSPVSLSDRGLRLDIPVRGESLYSLDR